MQHLSILLPEGQSNVSSLAGTQEIFMAANSHWKKKGNDPRFKIEIVGVSKSVKLNSDQFRIEPDATITQVKKTNLIIIPSFNHNYQPTRRNNNQQLTGWIRKQYNEGAEVASMCTGAFLLAETGLLDGRKCSTHWSVADKFRNLFPQINLQADFLITDEDGLYTNGGAYSFLNLVIYLVEKYYDRQTAIFCAKVFQVEMDRQSQSPFIIFTGQKSHGDDLVKKAQLYLENNFQERISIASLSSRFAVGRRNFDRRFIKATGNTPIEYSQRVRVETAKKALETSRKTINEVMYDVGYSDVKAFREVFRKITGLSPLEYKTRYNNNTRT